MLFPELLVANLDDDGFDPYVHLALVRRHLCRAAAAADLACNPARCRSGLAAIGPTGPGGTVNACKRTWQDYYDREFLRPGGSVGNGFADVLDELGLAIGME